MLKSPLLAAVATAALCATSHPALAQSDAADRAASANANDFGDANPEIVVTAQKRSDVLKVVPQAVDVVTGEKIEKLNIYNLSSISQLVPGLALDNDTGRAPTSVLRGIPFDADSGTDPAVDLYFNETPINPSVAFQAVYDVGQIEVLRGAQGALRARSSPAGAITVTTRRADLSQFGGYAQASASEDNLVNLQGAVNVPIISDTLAVRVSGLVDRNRLDRVYNVTTGQHNRSRTESGRLSVGFKPSENASFTLIYQHMENSTRLAAQVIGTGNADNGGRMITLRDRLAVADEPSIIELNSDVVVGLADIDLGFATLSYVGGYQHNDIVQIDPGDDANAIPGYTTPERTDFPIEQTTHELRLASNDNAFWDWMIGAYYAHTSGRGTYITTSDMLARNEAVPIYRLDLSIGLISKSTDRAIFTWHRFKPAEGLRIDIGARYAIASTFNQSPITISGPDFGPFTYDGISPEAQRQKRHPLTGSGSISYDFNRELTGYVGYSRSFRPGVAGVGVPAGLSDELIVTGPERSDQYEIGLKGSLANGVLRFSAAAFYQKFKGFIGRNDVNYRDPLTGSVEGTFQFNFNAPAVAKGIEMQATIAPSRYATLSVNASYAKAHFSNAMVPCNDFNQDGVPDSDGPAAITPGQDVSTCLTSDRLAAAPPFSMTINGEVKKPLGDLTAFLRGSFSLLPAYNSQLVRARAPGQERLDLFTGLTGPDGRWEISLWAKNVFNQQVARRAIGANELTLQTVDGPLSSGYRRVVSTVPRELGVTARMNF